MSVTLNPIVAAPSGKAIPLVLSGGATITNIVSPNEIQAILLSGVPAGNAFALLFGGHTTSSISVSATPPTVFAIWTFPVISGNFHVVSAESLPTPYTNGYALFETIEAGATVASSQRLGYPNPILGTPVVDDGAVNGFGYPVSWYPINTGVTASTSTMQVRITGAGGGSVPIYSIRVQDVTGGTLAYYSLGTTPSNLSTQGTTGATQADLQLYGSTTQYIYASNGPKYLVSTGASGLQTALQNLSSIGTGQVLVVDESNGGTGNYQVTFTGSLANSSQPLMICADPAVTISEITHGGVFPTLSINGGASVPIPNWLWTTAGDNPAAFEVLPSGTVMAANQSAVMTIPANWMTTSSGSLAATTLPIGSPSVGSILGPTPTAPQSLKIGYNIAASNYYFNFLSFSNLATMLGFAPGYAQGSVAVNSNGYPTKISKDPFGNGTTGKVDSLLYSNNASATYADPTNGTFVLPPGLYVVRWDGSTETVSLSSANSGTYVSVHSVGLTGTTGNQIIFSVTVDTTQSAGAQLQLIITSTVVDVSDGTGNTFDCNVTNLGVYPPDPSDATGNTPWGINPGTGAFTAPQKFHPWFLRMLEGSQVLRFMDSQAINNNSYANYSQIKPTTACDRFGGYSATIGIASVSAPNPAIVSPGYSAFSVAIQVTTTTPHGLSTGIAVTSIAGVGNITLTNSTVVNVDAAIAAGYTPAICQVIDTTNVILYLRSSGPGVMGATVTPSSATLSYSYGVPWTPQDICDLIIAVGCTDLHLNVPSSIDVSVGGCADQLAAFYLANLPAGLKIHIEFGNEGWNNAPGFQTNLYCSIQNGFLSGNYQFSSYEVYYAQQTKAAHDRFKAIFAAAGRQADIVCLWGMWMGPAGNATNAAVLAAAAAIGAQVDEVCPAVYYSNQNMKHGLESTQQAIYQILDTDQVADFYEFNSIHGEQDYGLKQVAATVAASSYPYANIVAYEGSCDNSVPDINGFSGTNYVTRRNAMRRHTRNFGITVNQGKVFAAAGLTMWSVYLAAYQTGTAEWDTYECSNQQPGTGNPAIDTLNVSEPQAKNAVASEVGGGIAQIAALYGPPQPTRLRSIIAFRKIRIS